MPPVLLLTWVRVMFAVPGLTPVTVTEGVAPQELKVSCEGLTVATLVLLELTDTTNWCCRSGYSRACHHRLGAEQGTPHS